LMRLHQYVKLSFRSFLLHEIPGHADIEWSCCSEYWQLWGRGF
jgi:hypothetical protein